MGLVVRPQPVLEETHFFFNATPWMLMASRDVSGTVIVEDRIHGQHVVIVGPLNDPIKMASSW